MNFNPPNTYGVKKIIQKWNRPWIIFVTMDSNTQGGIRHDLQRDGFDTSGSKWKETLLNNTEMYIVNAETKEDAENMVIGKYTAPRGVLEMVAGSIVIIKELKENPYKEKVHELTKKEKKKYLPLLEEEI